MSECRKFGGWKNPCKLVRTNCVTFYQGTIKLYARDIKEKHKARYNELKMHSLRTELKKLSKQQTNLNITLIREHRHL